MLIYTMEVYILSYNLETQEKLHSLLMMAVSSRWTGIWNGTVEWKMEWNSERWM